MEIINKFKNFELSQEDRIPKEDKENCERIQAIYEQTLSVYKKWYFDKYATIILIMKDKEVADEEIEEKFGIDSDILKNLMYKEQTENGVKIRWGEQKVG